MTDMTAFERQLSGEISGLMGPVRQVDDAAIFTAITTTQSPKWRFQSMFSATKYVVAGAIVALFGGFLLAGVLTQQPSDDRLPVVGASASATTQAEPTEVVTSEPEQTAEVDADGTRTTPDPLPGVDLVTEEVEPGVYRVLSDGVRDLSKQIRDVTVTPDGDAWVELGATRDLSLVQLGEPGVSQKLGRRQAWQLGLTSSGAPVARNGSDVRVFDGETWERTDLSPYERCVVAATQKLTPTAVAPDGSCYTKRFTDAEVMLARIDRDDSRTLYTRTTLGLEPQLGVGFPRLGPDGMIWAPLFRRDGPAAIFEGLLAYDGSTWSNIPYNSDDARAGDSVTRVDQDGVVWVSRLTGEAPPVLSWDGDSWASHLPEGSGGMFLLPVQPWPNGIVWFGSDARWDGTVLEPVEATVPWGQGTPLANAPDGSAWTVVEEQLYVITPEAVAATE